MAEHTEDEAFFLSDGELATCDEGPSELPCSTCIAELRDREARADAEARAYHLREDRDR